MKKILLSFLLMLGALPVGAATIAPENVAISPTPNQALSETHFARLGGKLVAFTQESDSSRIHIYVLSDGAFTEVGSELPDSGFVYQLLQFRENLYAVVNGSDNENNVWRTSVHDLFGWENVDAIQGEYLLRAGDTLLLYGQNNEDGHYVYTSTDGEEWSTKTDMEGLSDERARIDLPGNSVIMDQPFKRLGEWTYVLVTTSTDSSDNAYQMVKKSQDGIHWHPAFEDVFPNSYHSTQVKAWQKWNGALYIAAQTDDETITMYRSEDGETLEEMATVQQAGSGRFFQRNQKLFLVLSADDRSTIILWKSKTGTKWKKVNFVLPDSVERVTDVMRYRGKTYVGVVNPSGNQILSF